MHRASGAGSRVCGWLAVRENAALMRGVDKKRS